MVTVRFWVSCLCQKHHYFEHTKRTGRQTHSQLQRMLHAYCLGGEDIFAPVIMIIGRVSLFDQHHAFWTSIWLKLLRKSVPVHFYSLSASSKMYD